MLKMQIKDWQTVLSWCQVSESEGLNGFEDDELKEAIKEEIKRLEVLHESFSNKVSEMR